MEDYGLMEPQIVPARALLDVSRYPELGIRYRSIFIDTLVMVLLMFLASWLFSAWDNAPDEARMTAFVLIWGVYEPLANTLGGTVGNRLMKVAVRRFADETRRPNLVQSCMRYAVKLALGWLSFFTMGSNQKRRAIHDFASGTVVVYR